MKSLTLVLLVLTFALTSFAQTAPPQDGIAGFQNAQLLTPTTGWIWLGDRVLWTSTSGNNWQEISPSASQQQISSVFFLDENNGWALLTGTPASDGQESATVAYTNSGGGNWTTQPFSVSEPTSQYGLPTGSAAITFADAQHGWITVRTSSDSNADAGTLYATSDGGQNWRQLPAPPCGDPVRFVDAQFGWQAGGASGHELYVTENGGATWQAVAIEIPSGLPIQQISFADPVFSSPQQGILPVRLVLQDKGSVLLAYVTADGGNTWTVHYSVGTSALGVGPGAITDSLVVWSYGGDHEITFTDGDGTVTAVPDTWLAPTVAWSGFVDRTHGWIVAATSGCTTPNTNCWQRAKLLATDDGGVTASNITPK
jgi:photosystem II stability/assembly factor-like uncharacterized protein